MVTAHALSPSPVLEVAGLTKVFAGQVALEGVDLRVYPGEVHALLGQNGAGKSTLIKILTGVYTKDAGTIRLAGQPVDIRDPHHARLLGISVVHQELSLVPGMNAMENLFLGLPVPRRMGLIKWSELERRARKLLAEMDLKIDLTVPVRELSVAEQWMVAISRALVTEGKVLILDEPTAALTRHEVETLFRVIRSLTQRGVAVVYVSHRMNEVRTVGNRATVLKDGTKVADVTIQQIDTDKLIAMIAGRSLDNQYPKQDVPIGAPLLEVKGLSRLPQVRNVTFTLRRGEILGLAGLAGAGRTETARIIFGADSPQAGQIMLEGQPLRIRTTGDAVKAGIALIPEERRTQGLIMARTVRENMTLASLPRFCSVRRLGLVSKTAEMSETERMVRELKVKGSPDAVVRFLSGGNQQKVVIGRWLVKGARVFIFDEPTRGIDVSAKVEVYRLMQDLAAKGAGVLFISSDFPELIGIADRILVMCEGRVAGEISRQDASEEAILRLCYGGDTA